VESEGLKKRFHDLSPGPPETDEHAPEVLQQQLVTRDVEKYRKLLEQKYHRRSGHPSRHDGSRPAPPTSRAVS
jgi:hypothetical protein